VQDPLWKREDLNAGDYSAPQSGPLIDVEGVVAAGDTGSVIAFDLTGREIWRLRTANHRNGVRTALTPYRESIVFCGFDGYAYRVERTSGRVIWSVRLGDFIGATPAVDSTGDRAYVAANNDNETSAFFCISLAEGKVLWRRHIDAYAYARPAIAESVVVRASNNGEVEGLSPANGEPVWRARLPAQVKGWIAADGPRCFLGCFDGNLYALESATGAVLWRKRLAIWLLVHPATTGGDLIVSSASHLCRVAQQDGALRWLAPIGGRATGVGISEEHGICLVGSEGGVVCTLDLTTGARRWQIQDRGRNSVDTGRLRNSWRIAVLRRRALCLWYRKRFDERRNASARRIAEDEILQADALRRATPKRRPPYIYRSDEIVRMLRTAAALEPAGSIRPILYTTLLGLIAATGMRIAEALALQLDDVTADGLPDRLIS
jgi:outer membrane protein assembly factor BamB